MKRCKPVVRLDFDAEPAAARRVETIALELQSHLGSHPFEKRQKCQRKKVEGRRRSIVRAPFDDETAGRASEHKSWKDGLKHEGSAAGRPHRKVTFARPQLTRRKVQRLRAQTRALDFRATNFGGSQNGCHMLTQQSW